MGNVTLGFPNNVDTSTLAGGSWVSTLPITNMQNRSIGKVARTTDDATSSTQFTTTLSAARRINVLSFTNHNLSLIAKYRIRASNEASITNITLYSEQFQQTDWVKTNATISANSIVAPDTATTADTITASASNATVIQDLGVLGSAAYTFSVWLKRLTGIGAISLTLDGGSTYTAVTLTTSWTRFSITQTLANPDAGIKISTNGDAIYAWGTQVESAIIPSSYYPSVASVGVRPAGYIDSWQNYKYNSGWSDVYPVIYPYPILEWSDDNWWSGRPTLDDISGYTTCLVHLLPTEMFARYWKIEFDDTLNSDGYIQIGRMLIAPTWQPAIGIAQGGLNIGWETRTSSQETISGSEYFQKRTPYRVATFTLDKLTEDEAFAKAFEIQRRAGIDQEILYIHDPADTAHSLRRRFLARLRQLSAIEFPYGNFNKAGFELRELL